MLQLKRKIKFSSAGLSFLMSLMVTESATAQKLNPPGGWRILPHSSDNFNDTNVGWQWKIITRYEFQQSTRKNGSKTWCRFRPQNLVMNGSNLVINNLHHSSPLSAEGRSYDYSGAWMESKATWITEGQFQARTKVQWNFPDIWPTFWLIKTAPNIDELDIMEYQSNQLNQTHHVRPGSPNHQFSARKWVPWMNPQWHHTWAMAQVRNWNNWAARSTRNSNAQFYINAKLEHTSNLPPVVTGMHMIFSSSPHFQHLPDPGNYPNFSIDWVETHIP